MTRIYPFRVMMQEVFAHTGVKLSRIAAGGGWRLVLFATMLAAAAVVVAVGLITAGYGIGPPLPVLALAGLAFFAERRPVRLSASIELSVTFLPFVFAAVVFGPLAAMAVGVVGLLAEFRAPYVRWAVWTGSRALCGAAAGIAAALAPGSSSEFGALLSAAVLAAVAEVAADWTLSVATVKVRGTGTLAGVARSYVPLAVAAALYTPVIALLAYAYAHSSAWSVVLFLIPAFAAQRLFLLYHEQRETAQDLAAANVRLEKANLSFATALVATLDARDRYTAGHSAAVAIYARDIAARMGLPEAQQELVHLAGLVHDIGKIGLPVGVLEKDGPLTLEERRTMEKHSEIGERILKNVEDYHEIATIVRHHHERVDGMGYPDGLAQDEIPLLARIIAVADAYDAMTSDRPYRDAMPSRVARLRLAQAVESQFDTTVVAAFEAILAGATDGYRSGRRGDFGFERQDVYTSAARAS